MTQPAQIQFYTPQMHIYYTQPDVTATRCTESKERGDPGLVFFDKVSWLSTCESDDKKIYFLNPMITVGPATVNITV